MIQTGADMMFFFHRGAALFIGSLFVVGCSSPQEASWKTSSIRDHVHEPEATKGPGHGR